MQGFFDIDMTELVEELGRLLEIDAALITPESVLESFANWDSLTQVSIVAYAFDRYGVNLASDELAAMSSVSDIAGLIGGKRQAAVA